MPHFEHGFGEGEEFDLTEVCQVLRFHQHAYPHDLVVITGVAGVEIEGQSVMAIAAGESVTVPALTRHQVKALAVPLKYQCRFLHRNKSGEVVLVYEGNAEACT